jgi:hypothetical protein
VLRNENQVEIEVRLTYQNQRLYIIHNLKQITCQIKNDSVFQCVIYSRDILPYKISFGLRNQRLFSCLRVQNLSQVPDQPTAPDLKKIHEVIVPVRPTMPPTRKATGMLEISAITPNSTGPNTCPTLSEVVKAPVADPIP